MWDSSKKLIRLFLHSKYVVKDIDRNRQVKVFFFISINYFTELSTLSANIGFLVAVTLLSTVLQCVL